MPDVATPAYVISPLGAVFGAITQMQGVAVTKEIICLDV